MACIKSSSKTLIPALQSIYNWADGQMKEKTE